MAICPAESLTPSASPASPDEISSGQRISERQERVRPRGGVIGQLFLVVGAWLAYSGARSFSGQDVQSAVERGQAILRLDDALGFGWVLDVNEWALQHGVLAVPLSIGYASLHYLVTPLVLVWLWRRHPSAYQAALFSLIVMSAIGLVVFVAMPVAPPRLLPGFAWMDMLKVWSDYGWWGGGASAPRGFEHLTNQYAAVPSLHVGWAMWCAWAWRRSGGRFARRYGWLYPFGVAVTVVVTGNHYVIDVVTGLAVAAVACWFTPRLMTWWSARRRTEPVGAGSVVVGAR
nr:phosphatase PAP2 family protein [Kineosporia babensis]